MAKKSFLNQGINAKPHGVLIGSAQEVQEAQQAQEVQEEQEAQEVMSVPVKTQGRKGMKQQRINMAFTPANIEYIRIMAALKGQTMTQYVNALIDADRAHNAAVYTAAADLQKNL